MTGPIRIGITHGMRGWFAVKYDDEGPIDTSPLSFKTSAEARKDAIDWANEEELPCDYET